MTAIVPCTVASIFSNLGGPAEVARMLNVKASTASEMKRRHSIPVRYWRLLITAASDLGISIDEKMLVDAHTIQMVRAS